VAFWKWLVSSVVESGFSGEKYTHFFKCNFKYVENTMFVRCILTIALVI